MPAATWFIRGLCWDCTIKASQCVWETWRWSLLDEVENMIQEKKMEGGKKVHPEHFCLRTVEKKLHKLKKRQCKKDMSLLFLEPGKVGALDSFEVTLHIFSTSLWIPTGAQQQWCVEHILFRLRGREYALPLKGRGTSIPRWWRTLLH